MRVLHVNLSGGGIGRYGVLLGHALARTPGVEALSLLHASMGQAGPFADHVSDMPHELLRMAGPLDRLRALRSLRTAVRRFRPDVIHDSAGSTVTLGCLTWARLGRRCPLVLTEHDPQPHTGMGRSWIKRRTRLAARRHATGFIVHGPRCAEALAGRDIDRHRIAVIPHGELGVFAIAPQRCPPREPNTLLFFGALRPNKGVGMLPDILEAIVRHRPDVRLIVAGSPQVSDALRRGGWSGQLHQILDRLRRFEQVELHARFIDDDEVGSLFARAELTLLPYTDATQSGVAMIAMPLGSVCVATAVGDLPEVIEDTRTGLLCEARPEAIAQRVLDALADRGELETMRSRAREWVIRHCAWPAIARQTLQWYEQVVAMRRREAEQ